MPHSKKTWFHLRCRNSAGSDFRPSNQIQRWRSCMLCCATIMGKCCAQLDSTLLGIKVELWDLILSWIRSLADHLCVLSFNCRVNIVRLSDDSIESRTCAVMTKVPRPISSNGPKNTNDDPARLQTVAAPSTVSGPYNKTASTNACWCQCCCHCCRHRLTTTDSNVPFYRKLCVQPPPATSIYYTTAFPSTDRVCK